LSVPLVAAASDVTDRELEQFEPGGAWAPGKHWTMRRDASGAWHGSATLIAPLAEAGLGVLVGDERGVVVDSLQARCPVGGATEGNLDGVRASHVLRVEFGYITLSAQAWAAALELGARLPPPQGPALVRVDGHVVALGHIGRPLNGEDVVRLDKTFPRVIRGLSSARSEGHV
jgi:hypothetical protein